LSTVTPQLDPDQVEHVRTRDLHYGIEHTFFARIDFEIDDVVLTEGQRLGWFDEATAAATKPGRIRAIRR
jgi:8-oxo-dGTP diphosphatase